MSDRDEFLAWVDSSLVAAEQAMLSGDEGPRKAIWSRTEPVSVLGAWRNAVGRARRCLPDLCLAMLHLAVCDSSNNPLQRSRAGFALRREIRATAAAAHEFARAQVLDIEW